MKLQNWSKTPRKFWVVLAVSVLSFLFFFQASWWVSRKSDEHHLPEFLKQNLQKHYSTEIPIDNARLRDPLWAIHNYELVYPNQLIPTPRKVDVSLDTLHLLDLFDGFVIKTSNTFEPVSKALDKFSRRARNICANFLGEEIGTRPHLELSWEKNIDLPHFKMNESYSIVVPKNNLHIKIEAATSVGIMHALQTLLQLIEFKDGYCSMHSIVIHDSPLYSWRGLMIDVARHYQGVKRLKVNIEAMSMVKLNVLHLHLSDDQGFRFESKKYPQLQKCGGYHPVTGDKEFYTQEELKEIIQFAAGFGIRVIPELDLPGHVGGWCGVGHLMIRQITEPEPKVTVPSPNVLDISKPEAVQLVSDLHSELAELFPDEYLHVGADEVPVKIWQFPNVEQTIRNFYDKIVEEIQKKGKKPIGWGEVFGHSKKMTYQTWLGHKFDLVTQKKPQILSTGFYLDLGEAHHKFFSRDILVDPSILGGEACMWTEYVGPNTLDAKLWPSSAVIAEVFWSNRNNKPPIEDLQPRVSFINFLMDKSDFGLQHLSAFSDILMDLAKENDATPLKILASLCKQGFRQGTQNLREKPLIEFIDALTVEAPAVHNFEKLVNIALSSVENWEKHNSKIKTIAREWIDVHNALMSYAALLDADILDFSQTLQSIGKCILDSIRSAEGESVLFDEEQCGKLFGSPKRVRSNMEFIIGSKLSPFAMLEIPK